MNMSDVGEAEELPEPKFTDQADNGNLVLGSKLHP